MLNKIKRIYIVSSIMALPILISCSIEHKEAMPAVKNHNEKVALECVVPLDDEKKNEAFKNFETDIKPLFPDCDIHLTYVKGNANAYNTKIKVMMYSDTPPDIFYSGDGNFTEELYSSKKIQLLGKKLNDINYWNMVIPTAKVIGDTEHIYAIPIDEVNYNVMLINTKIFSENNVKIPESFEELKTASKQFKKRSIIPIVIGGKDGRSVYNMIEGFACTLDNKISSKLISNDVAFSGKTFSRAATSIKQLIELGAFQEKTEAITDEEAENLFYSSKAAIYYTSSEKLNMASNQLNGKVAVLYYPHLSQTNGSIPKCIVSGGTKKDCGLLISSATKYPTEAVKLAVEMSKYYNKYLYEKLGNNAIIYNLDNMGWTPSLDSDLGISKLMMNVKQKGNINTGLFGYHLSPDKEKSIEEASTAFITGLLSVSDYLEEMDINMNLK
ncbi:ABC transporter substrate-binding protein [Desulfosporosinus nitroreducens]|uniref:ABC transporter substrate-binding protein n=1 Tax=Desulfosporosinus nitroreducens TaxID=2018668 RepID=UPI00207D4B24|nr:extracellular solute-binding protein [Desulfosporosinus nitroreducens]MCO1603375.1 extracellular solute-binding protein [Desulfosporosinus nitroreducens]